MRRHKNEKNLSTTQHSEKEDSWLSGPDVHERGKTGNQKETEKRQEKINSLKHARSLRRNERIRSKRIFNKVLRSGNWLACKYFAIYFDYSPTRAVGFTVSKKIRKKPQRNRIKRRLREIYRQNKELLPESGFYIFMGLPPALEADFHTLQKSFRLLAQKLTERYQSLQSR